jgi:putative photosynthetic complex assembly protein 2
MNDRACAAVFVIAIWWLSTGIVLRMVWLGRKRVTIGALSVLAFLALFELFASSKSESIGSAYLSFTCALTVWGWHELLFLLGIVTGPRRVACPQDARGWRRFGYATAAIIHHEIALAATLAMIAIISWGQPNQVGTSTFAVLWAMRLSAKFNVFLGVRNLTEQFVPPHLRYMLSYFRRARMNWLMPASLIGAGAVFVRMAVATPPHGAEAVGRSLVATLLALALLEHLFLAFPFPDARLWQWAIRVRRRTAVAEPVPGLRLGAK